MSLFKVKTKHELDMEKGFIQGPQKKMKSQTLNHFKQDFKLLFALYFIFWEWNR